MKLDKCPHCAGDARYIIAEDYLVGTKYAVLCNDCRARTDWWPRASDAANAWNVRVGGRKLALERREC